MLLSSSGWVTRRRQLSRITRSAAVAVLGTSRVDVAQPGAWPSCPHVPMGHPPIPAPPPCIYTKPRFSHGLTSNTSIQTFARRWLSHHQNMLFTAVVAVAAAASPHLRCRDRPLACINARQWSLCEHPLLAAAGVRTVDTWTPISPLCVALARWSRCRGRVTYSICTRRSCHVGFVV